jgi:imidazolonepropionase-like amidohydrolase
MTTIQLRSSLRAPRAPRVLRGESLLSLRAAAVHLLLFAVTATGQDLGIKAAPQSAPVVITNATIHTISGEVIKSGHVAFDEGVITSVGPGVPATVTGQQPKAIDAAGKHVFPGLIGANTVMGLTEVSAARATLDSNEVGDLTPEVRPAVALNPDSALIPVARTNGVLLTGVLPMGGLLPGRVSVVRHDGWTWEDMTVRDDAGLVVNWPNLRPISAWWMTKSESEQLDDIRKNLARLNDFFDAAAAYHAARAAGAADAAGASLPTDLRYESLKRVLSGELPIFVRADEWDQIESAVNFAVTRKLKLVIVGGRDAPLAAESLKKAGASVIVTGTFRMPKREDSDYNEAFTLPARLESMGVSWCLATEGGDFQTPHERNLPYHAALAVSHGLSREAAHRAVTLFPAKILGVADRYGSIEKGKSATLFICDGDPLEMTTKISGAWIDGREIDLRNKQTELDAKYREKYRRQK